MTPIVKQMAFCFVVIAIAAGCSSSNPKSDIASGANPADEVNRVQGLMHQCKEVQCEVLAARDYKEGLNYLESAKDKLAAGREPARILNELSYAQALFERGQVTARERGTTIKGVLSARLAATRAGAGSTCQTFELNEVDKEIAKVEDFDKDFTPKDLTDLEAKYFHIEGEAIVHGQLGDVRAQMDRSINDGAKKKAPVALKKAQVDLGNAENVVRNYRNTPTAFEESVAQAKHSSQFLAEILSTMEGSKMSETAATQIVTQRRQIAELNKNVTVLSSDLEKTAADKAAAEKQLQETSANKEALEKAVQEKEGMIQAKDGSITKLRGDLSVTEAGKAELSRTVAGQQATIEARELAAKIHALGESARQQLNSEEAEVMEQGSKLVIRLKKVSFERGTSDLTGTSMEILQKVKDIATNANPTAIKVEGHTDSTGQPEANQKLSEKRATSVAKYLESEAQLKGKIEASGEADKRPIATNRTAEGRAQNRRVDVTINIK